jgi:hypothetical protein
VQRRIEQATGVVTGKRSSGGIGTVLARRKTNDQQPGLGIAERGDRSAVVIRMPCAYGVEMGRKAGTGAASRVESGPRAIAVGAAAHTV